MMKFNLSVGPEQLGKDKSVAVATAPAPLSLVIFRAVIIFLLFPPAKAKGSMEPLDHTAISHGDLTADVPLVINLTSSVLAFSFPLLTGYTPLTVE